MSLSDFYRRVNDTASEYRGDLALHELIGEASQRYAHRTAVRCNGDSITYRDFDRAVNQLASFLVERGVRKADMIGVCCERNIDTPILLTGILRAGASYVPLDPDYPLPRLHYMVENAELKLVLAHNEQRSIVEQFGCQTIYYDAERELIARQPTESPFVEMDPANDIAYVIYTSGSTGKPKGVLVPHRPVVNLLQAFQSQPGFNYDDRLLATTTLSFDISVIEMFLPLASGGELVIVDRATAKDQNLLVNAIRENNITFMQATPSHWQMICEADFNGGRQMKFVTAGEALPRDLIDPLLARCGELWNCYGPTETTVYSSIKKIENANDRILVGPPLPNTTAYVVDESGQLCPTESEGELWIGGDCVTKGYLKRAELTHENFVDFNGDFVYRSGDLAKILESGEIEVLGRIDSQVKINGHRIELGEIEAAMAVADPDIRLAAAVVREDTPGDLRLIGYVLPHKGKTIDLFQLKSAIEGQLPSYMVPSRFSVVDEFPFTPTGKTDRTAFPPPSTGRPDLGTEYVAPDTEQERLIAKIWCELLQFDDIGVNDNFFDLGGNSLKSVKVVKLCNAGINSNVSNAQFFDSPTIRKFIESANSSNSKPKTRFDSSKVKPESSGEFAVVGMAVKLPGATNVREFWNNLCEGKESIRFIDEDELDSTLPPEIVSDPGYVRSRGIIDDADLFDAKFFNMPPREAELVDPQQRIMLELSWTALEDAGCIPARFEGRIGIWAGTYETSYFTKNLLNNREIVQQTGEFQLGVYNEKDYIATRIAHKLNLTGPAINVNTACSTSLVAIIQACQSLESGFCDVAIAGAASVHFPQHSGHLHQPGSIFSPDGHCRPFDANSGGTLFSDGAGAVVLKRLEDAIEANDRIYAVVKGFGLNNDGGEKASFSAPSIKGQANVIAMAHADAGVDAASIGYVEAHGTATPIGDPIEVAALTRAFDAPTGNKQFCAIGSVKSNVGHTVSAAGVTGFVKTVLALHNEKIPATLHFEKPNPQIDFESTPFFVCDKLQDWKRSTEPRLAGVSSFGVGGTNAHVVLQEAPLVENKSKQVEEGSVPQIIALSARCENALGAAVANLANELEHGEKCSLNDVAATLSAGRQAFGWRAYCVANTAADAAQKLADKRKSEFVARKSVAKRKTVFMFPGQGSQYAGMGQELYAQLPEFKTGLDQCCEILKPLLERDLREVLFPVPGSEHKTHEILQTTQFTQPALFSIGYSLAKTLMSLGIAPVALVGHSIGEFAAACVAGVFSLEDGLKLVAHRGELMQDLPGGSMLSIRLAGVDVEPMLQGSMSIASYNSPQLCVVAGPTDEVAELQQRLEEQGVACKQIFTSHAFHSHMMDSIVDPFEQFAAQTTFNTPRLRILSTVTGKWMTDEQATDPHYWAEHLRKPVRFSDAIVQLWNDEPDAVMVELGPRRTLATLAMQHVANRKSQFAVPTMSDGTNEHAEWKSFLDAMGNLWSLGLEVELAQLVRPAGQKISLPTYPFQRKKFFITPQFVAPKVELQTNDPIKTTFNESSQQVDSQTDSYFSSASSTNHGIPTMSRIPQVIKAINDVFENSSGFDLNEFDPETTFFEIGLDSLVLTQTATALKNEFGVEVTFRQLLEETTNVALLAEFFDRELPQDQFKPETVIDSCDIDQPTTRVEPQVSQAKVTPTPNDLPPDIPSQSSLIRANLLPGNSNVAETVINNQLQIMAAQLQLLGGDNVQADRANEPNHSNQQKSDKANDQRSSDPPQSEPVSKKAFGAAARVNLNAAKLTAEQKAKLDEIVELSIKKMPGSKSFAQRHRQNMADPRTVSGFRPDMKEMAHPIVVERSKDVYLWDVDGNKYIDYTCGFGSNFLGHTHESIVASISDQLTQDFSIGPQSPLAGEVAELFCDLTGNERMAFSNTGSEAVLGCTRLARTFTGKNKVVIFNGDYHGILDEVIVRGSKNLKSFPAATGIPREHVDNTLILEYGDERSLEIIRDNLDDLAAVVVEPVQSRRPELQPREFLAKLRGITEDVDTALIFDEVITGFRIAPGGAQQHFGIRADLASYGKVVGGGMPIGLIGGRAKYMDGLDGGYWQYGDDSRPEAGMTYFAGTFVRHPLTLAASKSILTHIKQGGQPIYDRLNALSDNLADQLNAMFQELGAPMLLANFGSLFKVQFEQELPYSELVFASLRLKGFHIWDHRPCLLTLAHRQEHIDAFVAAFRETVIELQRAGFVPGEGYKNFAQFDPNRKPCSGAKVGKDRNGNPGWFIADAANPGQFLQVNHSI